MDEAPKVIFLEPACGHHTYERLWCEDDVWDGACEECGAPVFRYKLDGPVRSAKTSLPATSGEPKTNEPERDQTESG